MSNLSHYVDTLLTNATNNTLFGLNAMGAVETDFNCSSMCWHSDLFTFSDTSRGPAMQNCSMAVRSFVSDTGKAASTAFWVFGVGLFLCAIFTSLLWNKDSHHLESPLLGK